MIKVVASPYLPVKSLKQVLIKGRKTLGTRTKISGTSGYHREGYELLYTPKPDYHPRNVYLEEFYD